MDFTVKKYEEILQTIKDERINTYTVLEWLNGVKNPGIFIRHDIDRMADNAIEIAELEHQYGINATYYFRIVKASFKPDIIKHIASMGHEIGYHYEELSDAKGNFELAIDRFEKNLNRVRELAPVKTIAMHGRPLSKHDNRDMWKRYDVSKFALKGEAFLSIDYSDVFYFTDTGRNWDMQQNNLRDKTESKPMPELVESTDDLITFIKKYRNLNFALVTHPERWNSQKMKWLYSYTTDNCVNLVKKFLRR